jgi:hypothetical protein
MNPEGLEDKMKQAKKEVMNMLIEDKPDGCDFSKEEMEKVADQVIKNYLTMKEIL